VGGQPEIPGVLSRRYDDAGRIIELVVAGAYDVTESIILERGSDGRVLSIDRPPLGLGVGPDERFTYNDKGQRETSERMRDGFWQTMASYTYDARGKSREVLIDGSSHEWDRDQLDRVTEHRIYQDGVLYGSLTSTYQNGQLIVQTDSKRGTSIYAYDPVTGLPTGVEHDDGALTLYEYDVRSRLVAEIYVESDHTTVVKTVEYEYDLADRRIGTYDNGNLVLGKTFLNGRDDCTETGNGLERCFTYDPDLGARDGSVTTNAFAEVVEVTTLDVVISEDPAIWELSTTTDIPNLGTVTANFTVGPGTDDAVPDSERGKTVTAWDDGAAAAESYVYDSLGNRVDDAAGDTFTYNQEGDLLLSAVVDGEPVTYTYDSLGRASSRNGLPIERTPDGRPSAYDSYETEWDMQGNPLRFTDTSTSPSTVQDWSRWGGDIETNDTGDPVKLDLGEVVLGFAGENLYRHLDFRGNVGFVSNEAGEIITVYEYSAYGVHAVVGDDSDPSRFVSRPNLGGIVALGARLYDPLVGRFLEPDPVPHILNQYAYAGSNPIWFWDPDGRKSDAVIAMDVGLSAMGMTLGIVLLTAPVPPVFVGLGAVSLAISIYGFARALGTFETPEAAPAVDPSIDPAGVGKGPPPPKWYSDIPKPAAAPVMAFSGSGNGGGGFSGGFSAPVCGLGFELVFLLPPIMRRRRQNQKRSAR
jgi:RHS repeat-associated protein